MAPPHFIRIATDLAGAIVYWAPGAERLYGWSAEEVHSRSIVDVIPVVAAGHDRVEVRTRLTRGEPWAGMMQRGRRDGSTFVAELSTTPVFDDTGRLVGNISVCADVSSREEAKRTLERTRVDALAASLLKSNFLATVSHEVPHPDERRPRYDGPAPLHPLDHRQREYAETVRASGDALLTILNDILDLSKIEAGRLDLESINFDVTAVIEDVAELFAGQAQAKGLELVVSIADEVGTAPSDDPEGVPEEKLPSCRPESHRGGDVENAEPPRAGPEATPRPP